MFELRFCQRACIKDLRTSSLFGDGRYGLNKALASFSLSIREARYRRRTVPRRAETFRRPLLLSELQFHLETVESNDSSARAFHGSTLLCSFVMG